MSLETDLQELEEFAELEIARLFKLFADRPDSLRRTIDSFSKVLISSSYSRGVGACRGLIERHMY